MNTETIESDRKQAVQDIKCACEKIRNSPVANVERSEYRNSATPAGNSTQNSTARATRITGSR